MSYPVLRCNPSLFEKDLSNKIYIVTGANSGVGLETTRQLVKQGAHVIMACRRISAAEESAATMKDEKGSTEIIRCDLGDLASIRDFAKNVLNKHNQIDGLINNAGFAVFEMQRTKDGFESMFGVNHLGHFLLTELLLDMITKTKDSRIVILSSVVMANGTKKRVNLDFEDLNYEKRTIKGMGDGMWAYSESKFANFVYARELANRVQNTGTTVVSVHPGWVRSNFGGSGWFMELFKNWLSRPFWSMLTMMDNVDGAQTSLHCLLDDDVPNHSGAFYSQNSILYEDKECRGGGWPMKSPNPNCYDNHIAKQLIDVSRSMVGLSTKEISV